LSYGYSDGWRLFEMMKPISLVFCVCFLGGLGCTDELPNYVQRQGDWNPESFMWLSEPPIEAHRLQAHGFAIADIPIRLPEALRRAAIPERGAGAVKRVAPKRKGPPGMIKVMALRGSTETEAFVWINGLKAGKTPMFVHLASGSHRLEIQTPSGEKQKREVQIRPKSNQHVVFHFPLPED
jgi:hypothetical protein